MYFLYAFPQLNCVMMPIVIAMVASRLADMEHKGQTFRMLHTVQAPASLFVAKLLCGYQYILLAALLQAAYICAMGLVRSFGPLPWAQLGLLVLTNLAVGLLLYLFQQIVSLLFQNQLVPLILGLAGGFLGLTALFLPGIIQKLVPWAYYGVLCTVRLEWFADTRVVNYYWTEYSWSALITLGIGIVILYAIGNLLYSRKEM